MWVVTPLALDLPLSFNYIFLLILLLNFGCGVKSSPTPPQGTMLPSIEAPFIKSVGPTKKVTNNKEDLKKEENKKVNKKVNKKASKE